MLPSILEMLKAGVHFGHKTSKWHPSMKTYISTIQKNIHIIDLDKTLIKLQEALDFTKKISKTGCLILFVGTKTQAKSIIAQYAESINMPYVSERWLGGTLTNFVTIQKLIAKYKDLQQKETSGEFTKYSKKEQLVYKKELTKLEKLVKPLVGLTRLPDAIFIVDLKKDKIALHEANVLKIPVIAMCDTNVKHTMVQYAIPANDDSIKSIDMITGIVAGTIKDSLTQSQ